MLKSFFRKKIVLVEDDLSIANLQKKHLEKEGYKIEIYSNPYDVINKYKNNPDKFDVLITDLDMPQMSGTEMLRQLELKNKPVIMISGCDIVDVPEVKEVTDIFFTKHDALFFLAPKIKELLEKYELSSINEKDTSFKKVA